MLGIPEVAKPAHLAARGGCWFEHGDRKVHLGVDKEFVPARKAHPAFIVADLLSLVQSLRDAGYSVVADQPLEGYERMYVDDPFWNRIELMRGRLADDQKHSSPAQSFWVDKPTVQEFRRRRCLLL
jgi:hypothetical protein